jgi:hypothetical protein
VQIKVRPIDAQGNYLGPGFRDRLTMEVPEFSVDSAIEDRLDGSYTRSFLIPAGSLGTNVKIAFEQELIFSGSVREAFLRGWILILLLLLLILIILTFWFMKKKLLRKRPLRESST